MKLKALYRLSSNVGLFMYRRLNQLSPTYIIWVDPWNKFVTHLRAASGATLRFKHRTSHAPNLTYKLLYSILIGKNYSPLYIVKMNWVRLLKSTSESAVELISFGSIKIGIKLDCKTVARFLAQNQFSVQPRFSPFVWLFACT